MSESFLSRSNDPGDGPEPDTPRLVLVKGQQRYVFECAAGEESAVLRQLRELAEDHQSSLNWFDAAVLSHQLGQRMRQRLR